MRLGTIFLNRFPTLSARISNLTALRVQFVVLAGAVTGAFALLFVIAACHLDGRRAAAVERARAESIARSAAVWLDGDAHAGQGANLEKRLSDLSASLGQLAETNGLGRSIVTLRPNQAARAAIESQPGRIHTGALAVVLQSDAKAKKPEGVDWDPAMKSAWLDGETSSTIEGGTVVAYAPLFDSWSKPAAIIVVQTSAHGSLWRRAAFVAAALILACGATALVVQTARFYVGRFAGRLERLALEANSLARGDWTPQIETGGSPRELAHLADSLEALRQTLKAYAHGQPPPPVPAPSSAGAAGVPHAANPRVALGDPSEFDLALVLQQLVEPARKVAKNRGIDFQLVFPEGVPSRLTGHPVAIYQALDALVRNAMRATEYGSVTLKVSRAGEGPEGWRLRFEVADTGPGIPFKDQPALTDVLVRAAGQDPRTVKEPMPLAASLARALGGDLGFESQPGQGTRFAFTALIQPGTLRPDPATRFQPRSALTTA